jgi:predicted deacylase
MKKFPELEQVERLASQFAAYKQVQVRKVESIPYRGESYPLYTFVLGSSAPEAPVFGLTGGVHGLEKIGTHVVLAYLEHLLERLSWDESLLWQLERMRIISMPLVNPVGMHRGSRSNGNDVDLMRNSPSLSTEGATPLLGGHRYGRWLPWYMGTEGKMEAEALAMGAFIREQCFGSRNSLIVDVHSGFGLMDQLWFPYARSTKPFPHLPEMAALKQLLDRVLPNHVYRFEPQSIHYTTHGDLWDELYDRHGAQTQAGSVFLPITLELGSWNWVKKNPFQLYYRAGAFNPMSDHRRRRALRRHLPLFDFLIHATAFHFSWRPADEAARRELRTLAMRAWYPQRLPQID